MKRAGNLSTSSEHFEYLSVPNCATLGAAPPLKGIAAASSSSSAHKLQRDVKQLPLSHLELQTRLGSQQPQRNSPSTHARYRAYIHAAHNQIATAAAHAAHHAQYVYPPKPHAGVSSSLAPRDSCSSRTATAAATTPRTRGGTPAPTHEGAGVAAVYTSHDRPRRAAVAANEPPQLLAKPLRPATTAVRAGTGSTKAGATAVCTVDVATASEMENQSGWPPAAVGTLSKM
ncbi:hypothetical protein HDU82_001773, partial [Entophlyctis luteolus]